MANRILVLTTEPLPLPGLAATGAGLRAWGLAFGLRAAGFEDVTIAFAADAIRGQDVDLSLVPGVKTFERKDLDEFIAAQAPDAIVFQHWGLMNEMKCDPPCPVAVDLAGPHLLERRLWNSPSPENDLKEKLTALSRADFVVCSGAFQRHYFLPFLIQAGFDPKQNLCPVIPFSMSPDMPDPDPNRDHHTFVFGGMFLPWQDPEATLRTLVETLEEKDRGKLLFIGGPHPGGDVSGGRFDSLMEFLKGSDRVEIAPVMPFDQMLSRLRQCGVAVDLMPRNAERELAFPTRTITYMWAGLPVIHNNYDELAEPIGKTRAGWAMDSSDQAGLKKLVDRLAGHREDVERRSKNAQGLVKKNYTWDKTITPLAEWCAAPVVRTEKRPAMIAVPEKLVEKNEKPRQQKSLHYKPRRPLTDTTQGPWYLSPIMWVLALPISAVLIFLFAMGELVRLAFRRR
jgi:glycosyltransferase involved in cell wall biosynthesis